MDRGKAEEMRTELENAAKPIIDFIYKYGSPYTKIIVEMDGAEMLSGECSCKFEVRD